MPTKRDVFQTPATLLRDATNDYSLVERQFENLGGIFVDVGVDATGHSAPNKTILDRTALLKRFLRHEEGVPFLSIVINVAGRPCAFEDVLRSIARQSFIMHHPDCVELVLVQDGPEGVLDAIVRSRVLDALVELPPEVSLQALQLGSETERQGRATARNVGIWHASPKTKVVMFIDDAMILHSDFVAEQMLRHMFVAESIALLGFKENRRFRDRNDYAHEREKLLCNRPDYQKDWKWSRVLQEEEATPNFDFGGRQFKPGSVIQYMQITANLKNVLGGAPVGKRHLPMFFHTGLTSVTYRPVREVGGFEEFFDVDVWGFEDSYLGLLLTGRGVTLVPCPSSVAYKVELEDEEDFEDKILHLEYHRDTFWECAKTRKWRAYSEEKLGNQIAKLWNRTY